MAQQLQVLFLPFLACLILTGVHVYLGIHVISRKVIFVDIALAQIAALGATVAFLLGYDPRSEGAYYVSLAFAVLAAVIFALTRTQREHVPQEAVIGLTYATASAAAILLADISPHGAEHLHDLLAGSIVWVTPAQIVKTAILYALIGAFHFAYRRRFLLISMNPDEAYAQGIHVRFWDFLFYLSFGVVITSSVQIAGVLLVFCYLVAPSVFAVMFFEDLRRRLLTGWTMAALVSAIGLYLSYDRPSGPTIMVCFAVALILGGLARAIAVSPRRSRAIALTAATLAIVTASSWALYRFRPAPALHGGEAPEPADPAAPPPEHVVGGSIDSLRAALRDSHENVRAKAVADLAATGDLRVVSDLVAALHDQSATVKEAAALALGRTGSRSALPALIQGLKNADEDEWVRLRISQAVTQLGDTAGIPVLLEIAERGDAKLSRAEALGSLRALSGARGAPPADPDAPDGRAALDAAKHWWAADGAALEWDAAARSFHRRR
ncbi:MAG TPA: iron chelate uptake ABC transporter family permease subunit [Verrucomicrobiae bacterium]|nr:iron chelate uptake ABC transporter family permease subunit [Verrucomicrobiae bacterium]